MEKNKFKGIPDYLLENKYNYRILQLNKAVESIFLKDVSTRIVYGIILHRYYYQKNECTSLKLIEEISNYSNKTILKCLKTLIENDFVSVYVGKQGRKDYQPTRFYCELYKFKNKTECCEDDTQNFKNCCFFTIYKPINGVNATDVLIFSCLQHAKLHNYSRRNIESWIGVHRDTITKIANYSWNENNFANSGIITIFENYENIMNSFVKKWNKTWDTEIDKNEIIMLQFVETKLSVFKNVQRKQLLDKLLEWDKQFVETDAEFAELDFCKWYYSVCATTVLKFCIAYSEKKENDLSFGLVLKKTDYLCVKLLEVYKNKGNLNNISSEFVETYLTQFDKKLKRKKYYE